jgi:hypothetical protein
MSVVTKQSIVDTNILKDPQCPQLWGKAVQEGTMIQTLDLLELFTNRHGIISHHDNHKSHLHRIVDKGSGPLPPYLGQFKSLTTKTMQAISCYKPLVNNYLPTWCHTLQDFNLLLALYLRSVICPRELRCYSCCL